MCTRLVDLFVQHGTDYAISFLVLSSTTLLPALEVEATCELSCNRCESCTTKATKTLLYTDESNTVCCPTMSTQQPHSMLNQMLLHIALQGYQPDKEPTSVNIFTPKGCYQMRHVVSIVSCVACCCHQHHQQQQQETDPRGLTAMLPLLQASLTRVLLLALPVVPLLLVLPLLVVVQVESQCPAPSIPLLHPTCHHHHSHTVSHLQPSGPCCCHHRVRGLCQR